MSKGQLGNFSTMSGGEFSVAGGATDDWYISKGAQYRWGFITQSDYHQCSVCNNDIMHSLSILRGLSLYKTSQPLLSFTIELPGVDRNGKFWEFSLPPSDITWVLTINANIMSNLNILKFNMNNVHLLKLIIINAEIISNQGG